MYIKFTQNVNFEGVNYTADSESKAVTAETGASLIAAGLAAEVDEERTNVTYSAAEGLMGPNGTIGVAGELYVKSSTYQEIPNTTPTDVVFDTVVRDDLGVFSGGVITLPTDIIRLDVDVGTELASTASTYGNTTGARSFIFEAAQGLGTFNGTPNPVSGTGFIRALALSVPWNYIMLGSTFTVKFSQNSGSTIRISGSGGTGGNAWCKLRMYRN